ncbi:hypothetical protein [Methanocella conradii]|uniref:hypothetical protein n=1 Tax=Methanocella conradii TaxID=1175444 RepID=UPI0024B37AE3|nr:hypothetical protein [Methanocella conradii]MDI6897924.1 hypothetical protein [Methanocella conradii]
MPFIDDLIKLMGLTTMMIIASIMLFFMLFFAYGLASGFTHDMQRAADAQARLHEAQDDYNYKLELVKEQTQRIDMYYAAKSSTSMSELEFRSWLGTIRALTEEFVARENNAIEAGRAYMNLLPPDSAEHERVLQNEATCREDVKKVIETYNGNVYIYNKQYGTKYGTISYFS